MDLVSDPDLKMHETKEVWERLVYPWGVSSLDQSDEQFHPYHEQWYRYHKDDAYHNGTIWLWNNGMAMQRMIENGQADIAYTLFRNMNRQALAEGAVGSLSENADAWPRAGQTWVRRSGTFLQAWSNSEHIRVWNQYFLGIRPDMLNHSITIDPQLPSELKVPWEKNSVPDESQSCLLRDILLQRADGTLSSLEKLVSGKRSILAFLEIGAEPTEHVLNEVLALEKDAKGNSKGIGCQLLFVLRQEKDLQHKTLQEVLALDAGSEIEILYDISGGASDANAAPRTATGDTASGTLCGWQETAKRMGLTEKLPVLAAVRPDGTGIYGSCGYHVGSVELMVRILKEAVRTEAD